MALPRDFPKWQSVYAYIKFWREVDEDGKSLLERALKRSSWRGPREIGAECLAKLFDRRSAEREQ